VIGAALKTALAGVLVPAFLAGAPSGPRLPARGETWLRVRTANFTLYGNATESRIKEVGLELEKLRAVLVAFKSTARTPVPTTVFVFRDLGAMEPYRPLYRGKPKNVSGLFLPGLDGNLVALPAGWNRDPRPFVYHEYLHDFLRSNFLPQPLWYQEGLADFYSSFRATDSEATVGLPVEDHIRRMREGFLIPLDRLFAVDQQSVEYNEEERQGTFYAESWALVHYLMRGNPRRTAELGRFLVLLQQGRPRDEAFRESFQTDYDTLLSEVRKYMSGSRYPCSVTKFSELKIPRETATEKIDYPETLVRLGTLLGRVSEERLPDAEAYFRAALVERPSYAGALAGIGQLQLRQKNDRAALESFARAVATGSADSRAWFYYGWTLLNDLARQTIVLGLSAEQRKSLEQAREALRKSLELDGGFVEARAALGRSYLVEDADHVEEGIAALEEAVRLLPSRTDLALDLATLYDRKKDAAKSEEIRKRVLGPEAAAAAAAARGRKSSLQEGLDRVNALLQEGRDEKAVGLLEQILAASAEDVRRAFDGELASLRRGAAKNRSVREFNEAMALLKKQELESARTAFRKVAETAEDPDLARAAREQAERIDQLLRKRSRPAERKPG
jgi:Protein of unknown function (DUF1570)